MFTFESIVLNVGGKRSMHLSSETFTEGKFECNLVCICDLWYNKSQCYSDPYIRWTFINKWKGFCLLYKMRPSLQNMLCLFSWFISCYFRNRFFLLWSMCTILPSAIPFPEASSPPAHLTMCIGCSAVSSHRITDYLQFVFSLSLFLPLFCLSLFIFTVSSATDYPVLRCVHDWALSSFLVRPPETFLCRQLCIDVFSICVIDVVPCCLCFLVL